MTNKTRFHLLLTIALLLLSTPVLAQTAGTSDWQSFGATGEEFTVIMPKDPVVETGKMPYHKMELNTRLYLSNPANGPVYAIASFSGIKSNPALYSEDQRLNSYVDAFKKFFVPRIKGKDAIGKMTVSRALKLSGYDGREYDLTVGELSGTVQVFVTRKRFYAISFLSNKKDEALRDRFISSFTLPEKPVIQAETATVQAPVVQEPTTTTDDPKTKANAPTGTEGQTETPTTKDPKQGDAQPTSGEKKPISGGVLNGKAVSLPLPSYPSDAKAGGISGTVNVQVTIDEYGNVIAASAASGHPSLQQAAVTAAYSARFSPTTLMGEPVKVTGVIVYNFKL